MSAPLRLVSICALVPLAACLGPEEWPQTIGWQPTIGACLVPLAGWEQPPEDMLEYEGPIHVVLSITAAGEDDPPEAFDCWSSIPGGLWSPPPNEPSRWVLGVDAAGAGWEVIIAEPSNLPIGRSGEVLDVTYAATLLAADGPLGRGSFVAENLSSGLSVHLLMGADSSGVAPPAPVTFSDGVSLATHRVWCGCWEERALDVSAPDRAFTLLRGESGWAGGWLVTHGGFDQPVVDGAGCRGSPAWECVHVEGEFALQAAVVGPARR